MRDTTERPEAVSAGTVKLVGSSKKNIVKHIDLLLKDKILYKKTKFISILDYLKIFLFRN